MGNPIRDTPSRDEPESEGDGGDLPSPLRIGQAERAKPWNKTQRKVVEILLGLEMYKSAKEKLSIEEMIKKTEATFKKLESTGKQNSVVRIRSVIANSPYIDLVDASSSLKKSTWILREDKIEDFKTMVNKFVEEKPYLAEEFGIKRSWHYRRISHKRDNTLMSTPATISSPSVVPKKRHSNKHNIQSVTSRTSSSVAPAQQAPSSKITPNLSKTIYGFSPTLYNVVAKSREGKKKVMVLKKLEALLNNVATKDDLKAVSEKLEDCFNRQIEFSVAGLEKMIENKLEAGNNTLLRHMNKMFEEFFAKGHNIDGRLSIASNVDDDEPRDDYYGQAIRNHATGEIYTIIRSLGYGSFGKVFKAKDAKNIECAIKVSTGRPGPHDVVHELKLVEAVKSAKERGDHPPRFLAVSDHFEGFALGEIRPCEKMECYAIDLFAALFERKLNFTSMQTLQVVGQISSALKYLHKLGFVHADIKPDNIMLANMEMSNNKFQRLDSRLIDCNVVVKTDGHPTLFKGQSVPYRAPEMALGIPCDGKIDVFSLGLTAVQMITGYKGFYVIRDSDVDGLSDFDTNAAILGEIQRLIGPIPLEMCKQSKFKEFRGCSGFQKLVDDDHRKLTMSEACNSLELQRTLISKTLSTLIRQMLSVDPKKRMSSAEIAQFLAEFTVPQPPKD